MNVVYTDGISQASTFTTICHSDKISELYDDLKFESLVVGKEYQVDIIDIFGYDVFDVYINWNVKKGNDDAKFPMELKNFEKIFYTKEQMREYKINTIINE